MNAEDRLKKALDILPEEIALRFPSIGKGKTFSNKLKRSLEDQNKRVSKDIVDLKSIIRSNAQKIPEYTKLIEQLIEGKKR